MTKQIEMVDGGFTLLEVLIALAIFSLLATITSVALKQSLTNRQQLLSQAERLTHIQLTLARLTHGEAMRMFPAFIGQPTYIELTRGGESNQNPNFKQSHLSRVGYLCQDHQLIRRTYSQLDSLKRSDYEEEVILDHLTKCRFAFLNAALQFLPIWHNGARLENQAIEALPKAIQLKLTLEDWGEVASLFIIPEAAYTDEIPK
jgi:general secretion pathway protein J